MQQRLRGLDDLVVARCDHGQTLSGSTQSRRRYILHSEVVRHLRCPVCRRDARSGHGPTRPLRCPPGTASITARQGYVAADRRAARPPRRQRRDGRGPGHVSRRRSFRARSLRRYGTGRGRVAGRSRARRRRRHRAPPRRRARRPARRVRARRRRRRRRPLRRAARAHARADAIVGRRLAAAADRATPRPACCSTSSRPGTAPEFAPGPATGRRARRGHAGRRPSRRAGRTARPAAGRSGEGRIGSPDTLDARFRAGRRPDAYQRIMALGHDEVGDAGRHGPERLAHRAGGDLSARIAALPSRCAVTASVAVAVYRPRA